MMFVLIFFGILFLACLVLGGGRLLVFLAYEWDVARAEKRRIRQIEKKRGPCKVRSAYLRHMSRPLSYKELVGSWEGPPDPKQAALEYNIKEMGSSAYTATIRGIMEGKGTPEEKDRQRKNFIGNCQRWPDDPIAIAVGKINTRANFNRKVPPWVQGKRVGYFVPGGAFLGGFGGPGGTICGLVGFDEGTRYSYCPFLNSSVSSSCSARAAAIAPCNCVSCGRVA
jgi:hypothetical protein